MKIRKINKPVIIHGAGRSGTTLVSNILSLHQSFFWISGYVNLMPKFQFLSILNRLQQIRTFEKFSRGKRYFPRPSEAYKYWNTFFLNFNLPSIHAGKIDNRAVDICISSLRGIEKYSKGKRFITKFTGHSRSEFIKSLFHEPKIIYIDRDPRHTIASYYKQRWFFRNREKDFFLKSKSSLLEYYTKKYLEFYNARELLKKFDILFIKYEDFISETIIKTHHIFNFLDEPVTKDFENIIQSWKINKDTSSQYNDFYNDNEWGMLTELLSNQIQDLDYPDIY